MSQPTPYARSFDFTQFATDTPSAPPPGVRIDAEFDAAGLTLGQILANLALIQRDDGRLANASVRLATLHSEVLASLALIGASVTAWVTAHAYTVGQIVTNADSVYLVGIAHTSGVLATDVAATRLILIFDSGIRSDFSGEGGAALIGWKRDAIGSVARTLASVLQNQHFDLKDFGATGDPAQDIDDIVDTALAAVCLYGGTLEFRTDNGEQYTIRRQHQISSLYPVNLYGSMFGSFFDPALTAPAILVGASMDYLFEYVAPDSGSRAAHGAGRVSGLAVFDPTGPAIGAGAGGLPGTYAIKAAFHFEDFNLGVMEYCAFHWLKGGVAHTELAVMSTIRECRARYCGDTSVGGNSIWKLDGLSPSLPTQSFLFENNRTEVCYSDEYLWVVADDSPAFASDTDIIIRGCKFEASGGDLAASNKKFIKIGAPRFLIEGCGINSTTAVAVEVTSAGRGQIVTTTFAPGSSANAALTIAGANNVVVGCQFEDERTDFAIVVTGTNNLIEACGFFYSGGVRFQGARNRFIGNKVTGTFRTSGFWLQLEGWAFATANTFDDDGMAAPTIGADCVASFESDIVCTNFFDRWTGKTCLRRESANSVFHGNTFNSVGTRYSEGVAAAAGTGFNINGTQVVGTQATGWTAGTGTALKGAIATFGKGYTAAYSATYTAPTISNPPTQAEVQTIATALAATQVALVSASTALVATEAALQDESQRRKALEDMSRTHGLIN